ncbi:MAG: response regulator receiver modulated diguanylate cyclase [Verrucomicrobia bacterium]|nr:response regulator receiver modulated diguanylate cyclase [Verrucomicrobiota bacterium]
MTRRILMIDDDRMQYRLTQAYFKKFRGEVFTLDWAATYEEGLEKLLEGLHAGCLLDYQLGERNGLELIRAAVAAGSRTPIVFLTADSSETVDIEAMHAGALDFLVKGEISTRALERSLRYALKLGETLEALRKLATHDQLTGLLNRREFDHILAEERERSKRFGHPFVLILVDIDHFKSVNDTYGHPAGDAVLQEIASRLIHALRDVDRAARFGGEEFALIIMQADRKIGFDAARRICAAVASKPVSIDGGPELKITISAGVAAMPADASTGSELIAAADKALYAAKKGGRNQAVAFSELPQVPGPGREG